MDFKKISEILDGHKLWLETRYTDDIKGQRAYLRGAYLRGAYLRGADLRDADLQDADLRDADLRDADLRGADLRDAAPLQCPESGSFIGYKKADYKIGEPVIVKLEISENAKRNSATSRKCRCSEALVVDITSIDGSEQYETAMSRHDRSFEYKVGEVVKVNNFDENRWNECSTGIHFFITRQEAVDY